MVSLYVGNLPFSITEDDLRALFAGHGPVHDVKLMHDRETGRPRGFGFVEMQDDAANEAMAALNGSIVEGRPLRINHAHQGRR